MKLYSLQYVNILKNTYFSFGREKHEKSFLIRINMSTNFWEEKLDEKSEQDLEEALEEIGEQAPEIKEEVELVKSSSENTIEINDSSFGGLVIGWLFTIIWCAGSFFATVMIGSSMIADIGTSDWDSVEGVVTYSEVWTSTSSEGGPSYCLEVRYEYVVNQITYSGDRVSYSSENSCDSWSADSDEDYPEGENVTVYYDPSNPNESVLETGLSAISPFMCCFIIFPLIGIFLLFAASKTTLDVIMNRN